MDKTLLNCLLRQAILNNEKSNVLEFLKEKGAEIHQKDENDNLLHLACRYNIKNLDSIHFLIDNNIDIHTLDNYNKSTTDYLLESNLSYQELHPIFEKLFKKGLNLERSFIYKKLNEKLNFELYKYSGC